MILKMKQVGHVGRSDDAPSWVSSNQVHASDKGSDVASAPEHAKDFACSKNLLGLGEVQFACLMGYEEDPQQTWRFFHQRYRLATTFSKAAVPTTLPEMKYTEQSMHEYFAKLE